MKMSMEAVYITSLYNAVAKHFGKPELAMAKSGELAGNSIGEAAKALCDEAGHSLVVSGSNDPKIQSVVNGINMMLGNYGSTIDLDNHSNQYKGIDQDMVQIALSDSFRQTGKLCYHLIFLLGPVRQRLPGEEGGAESRRFPLPHEAAHKPTGTHYAD